jgi:hypothetical protein
MNTKQLLNDVLTPGTIFFFILISVVVHHFTRHLCLEAFQISFFLDVLLRAF